MFKYRKCDAKTPLCTCLNTENVMLNTTMYMFKYRKCDAKTPLCTCLNRENVMLKYHDVHA